jgi:hypothetical protein
VKEAFFDRKSDLLPTNNSKVRQKSGLEKVPLSFVPRHCRMAIKASVSKGSFLLCNGLLPEPNFVHFRF